MGNIQDELLDCPEALADAEAADRATPDRELISGMEIINIWTMGSRYDNGAVALMDDKGQLYRMKAMEILKINTDFNACMFRIVQKRVHNYLEVVI